MDRTNPLCPACGHQLSMFAEPEPDRGERAAAEVAARLATWWFPMLLLVSIAVWLTVNAAWRPFEPHPTVMLAVLAAALSTIAACQGPLILLSQRRAALRDRERDRETYLVAAHSEADLHSLRNTVDELAVLLKARSSALDAGDDHRNTEESEPQPDGEWEGPSEREA